MNRNEISSYECLDKIPPLRRILNETDQKRRHRLEVLDKITFAYRLDERRQALHDQINVRDEYLSKGREKQTIKEKARRRKTIKKSSSNHRNLIRSLMLFNSKQSTFKGKYLQSTHSLKP